MIYSCKSPIKNMTVLLLSVLLFFSSTVMTKAYAEEALQLKLIHLQAEALSEENGDEVYISVTKYSNLARPEEFRIPSSPNNWFFKRLNEASNVNLWQGTLAKGEEIRLMISIAEQDFPPWDVDDLIGTVQVTLKEVKGRLIEEWSIPTMDGQPRIEDKGPVSGKGRRYVLHGDNSRYEAELIVIGHKEN
jgi:hypothetical protein